MTEEHFFLNDWRAILILMTEKHYFTLWQKSTDFCLLLDFRSKKLKESIEGEVRKKSWLGNLDCEMNCSNSNLVNSDVY